MAEFRQNADGSVSIIRELDSQDVFRAGGPKNPAAGTTPTFAPGGVMQFVINGGADTAGGLMSWQNNLGYDIILIGHVLNVTTGSTGASTVSFGQTAANGTTLSSNVISGANAQTTGPKTTGTPLAVLVPANTWITGSTATGASAGLVAKAIFDYVPA